jgi:hypothetical protein
MRRRILIACAWAPVALAGCGGAGDEPPKPAGRVRLQVTAPPDGALVRGETVDVRGRVSPPTGQVLVLGRPALVTRGSFVVTVPLEPGANVVDLAASAGRRTPAFAALRITRDVFVPVPDLAGIVEHDVEATLQPLGLKASIRRGGDIFELLRSGPRAVCEQQPPPGERVRRGQTVSVVVAKRCAG